MGICEDGKMRRGKVGRRWGVVLESDI